MEAEQTQGPIHNSSKQTVGQGFPDGKDYLDNDTIGKPILSVG